MQLGFAPNVDDKGQEFSGCMEASIDLDGWPTTTNGKYPVWVDTANFGDNCAMLFFNLPGTEEESPNMWPCRNGLYRKVQKNRTPCGDLDLTKKFGYA